MARGERVFVALGSNLGDRAQWLTLARERLAGLPETTLVRASSVEETVPLGDVPQGPYLNQMVELETGLEPQALLDACLGIETALGRVRTVRWGPRQIDLDIVRYGGRRISTGTLTVPHPELSHRPFWRRELTELQDLVPEDS
ncbi:MAG TPA: 2-amino-4-hydroxy-6-hydroxymethyldihydropteridine diphosphokinase [Gemmatimonadales bacterium]|jgi:2-amino-4-hydroxy-6-hydroxymethyldihydropteridine diphosphokinase|nr:2-amino-4-hydroxy-6-hydroxymethyldihydropteridine diphosphokinase [Gemmatimonadales bacterium]